MPSPLLHKLVHKIIPARLRCYARECAAFDSKIGIEFGGPSSIFAARCISPYLPSGRPYRQLQFRLSDPVEGQIKPQHGFHFNSQRAPGQQFVTEATDLSFLPDCGYDFVLSSHAANTVPTRSRHYASGCACSNREEPCFWCCRIATQHLIIGAR